MALINFSFNKYEKNLRVKEENLKVEFLTAQARQLYRIESNQPVVLSITIPGGKELLLVTDSQLQEVFYHNLSKTSNYNTNAYFFMYSTYNRTYGFLV
jgi:hypothetical protein